MFRATFALIAVVSCTALTANAQSVRAPDKSLASSLKLLANANLSCQTADDCVPVEVGTIPCGGPATFLVTNKNNRHIPAMTAINDKLVEAQQAFFSESGLMGICMVNAPGAISCVAQKCVISNR